ncbi:MAG TPA: DedA family protein [Oligoflexia bacterium]|nr:DedA family protein [Oligoflexia bacterium]HMP48051.1 DedA family protein [Oligoflexia bacterium]
MIDQLLYLLDLFLHLDKHLATVIAEYGIYTYGILALIIFCETGLVVTPFLPGDSLLFAAGALSATTTLEVNTLVLLLLVAAILGDGVNYHIGKYIGSRVFQLEDRWYFKKEYLTKTQKFYEKYGGKTIIIARFVPIVRTFAPFLAGVGVMSYRKFLTYNVTGAILWVCSLTYAGFFFGELSFVKKNFGLVILAIIILSVMPAVFELIAARREKKSR